MESYSPGELLRQANHYLERNDMQSAYPFVRRLAEIPGGDARSCVTAGLMALTLQTGRRGRSSLRAGSAPRAREL